MEFRLGTQDLTNQITVIERPVASADLPLAGGNQLAQDLQVHLEIFRLGRTVYVGGRILGTLRTRCVRCLEPLEVPITADLDIQFFPQEQRPKDPDLELEEDDLSVGYYEADEIDLGEVIRETVELSVPLKPLCSEDCLGLCPTCGANLNRDPCDCPRGVSRSPFAGIKELYKQAEGGN